MSASNTYYPNLPNAPIEEAIINLTVGHQKYTSLREVESICNELLKIYPLKKEWGRFSTVLQIGAEGTNASSDQENSFILSSEDQKRLLSISRDTLSLNRLRPYGSWEDFFADYKQAWEIYTVGITVEEISRLAIRYINSFTIPIAGWEDYLQMRPMLQDSCKYDTSTMAMMEAFCRYALVSARHTASAIVQLTIKAEDSKNLNVIMDIEVQSQRAISNYPGFYAIADTLSRLRDFKNQIFFSNLPRAEEQFA